MNIGTLRFTFLLWFWAILLAFPSFSQTLIINEMSNGPTGSQEYVELLVVDNTVTFDCNTSTPPCIDIRGWIFDDNSGFHGTNGIAAGACRFSNNPLWACVPVGTLILLYNNLDPNVNLPTIDILLNDGNCRIVAPLSNAALFDQNITTPGAIACSYPGAGWTAGGNWTTTSFNNAGDCARIVDLSGCEVFSVCYGSCNISNLIYFAGSGSQQCYYFNDNNPLFNFNWSQGTASAGGGSETPGAPNNAANAAYIAQFNNNCSPITPLVTALTNTTNTNCGCVGSATVNASGSIPGYTYNWTNNLFVPIGQNTATASNLCSGVYNTIITSSIGCVDTIQVTISDIGTVTNTNQSVSVCLNQSYTFPDGSSAIITANTTQTSILTSSIGCDSIINTTVTLSQPSNSVINLSACPNTLITFPDGSTQNVTTNTTQISNLTTAAGCDSIITTNVTVSSAIQTTQNTSICNNTSYTFPNGSTAVITANTSQISNLIASNGCDSIVTTNITVIPNPQVQLTIGVCQGDNVLLPDGTTQNNVQANFSFNDTYTAQNGCDSTVTINYVVTTPTSITQSVSVCFGQNLTFPDGSTQTNIVSNTSHVSNLISVAGCDSVITTNVTVQSSFSSSQAVTACFGSTFTYPDGVSEVIIGNTTHTSNLQSQFGCDSIVTTTLTALNTLSSQINDTICQGNSYQFPDGSQQTNISAYTVQNSILQASNGCDSIVTTQLEVLPAPISTFSFTPTAPTIDDNVVTFISDDLQLTSYNWTITDAATTVLNTSTDSILTHTFTTDQISPYVICLETASAASCLSETCVTVRINADISVFVPNGFSPNLDFENELFFPVITGSAFENYEFTIFNRWGQVIFTSTNYPEGWDGKFKGETAPIGVYVYKVYFKEVNSTEEYKFTGHVTLVR